jgi:hypothetical protein
MNHFPFTFLPDDFTHLLRINMQSTSKGFTGLKDYFLQRPDMSFLLKHCFQDIDESGNVDRIMKAVGWFGMRDRLANIYLYRLEHGSFPRSAPENYCEDILKFEDQFKRFTVDGYSRAFLLAFYLKFMLADSKSTQHFLNYLQAPALLSFLSAGKSRAIKIDWLCVILFHFHQFLGEELCLLQLKKGSTFQALWKELKENQQIELTQNLLAYGAAINEPDLFVSDLIQ